MGILSAFRFAFQNIFFTPVLYGVIASLAVFSSTWEKGDRLKDQLTDKMRSQQDTFDFIVVGAGSAGAVVANRLSEFHSVLLLEDGGEVHPFSAIPGLSIFLTNYPEIDWQHKTVTQTKSCLACNDQQTMSAGRNLGGSGNLNYLIHLRGNPKDYQRWADITNDPSWNYEELLPFFRKSENFVGDSPDSEAHGVGGPLQIQIPDYIGLAPEWNYAGREIGYSRLDLNGHYDEGFDTIFYPIKQGIRQATYRSYIQPCRNRPNLVIRKFSHVNRLIIRDGTNEVQGVHYDRHGHPRVAFANKEVILSAGAINSPKILLLSGIGPSKELEDCGIAVRSDVPVGKNLQDHTSTLLGPFFIKYPRSLLIDRDITPKSFLDFGHRGTGPLSSTGFQAAALITSSFAKSRGEIGWPDIQMTLFGTGPHRLFPSDISHAFNFREDLLSKYMLHALNKDAFFILVSAARPLSRGEINLKSQDPYKSITIDPRHLCDAENIDSSVLLEGIKTALHLVENTTSFQQLEAQFTGESFPSCSNVWFRSDEYWDCYLRHLTLTLNDASGTCAMGPRDSSLSVVDPQLKVIGVSNLRVVDASVMPTLVGANAQAATIMIGEKGASMILEQWKDSVRTSDGGNGDNFNDILDDQGRDPDQLLGNNQFGSKIPIKQDDFAKLFEDNPANFDSYGPLQKVLQDPNVFNSDPSTVFQADGRVPSSENPNTQIQPPFLIHPPRPFSSNEFANPSTPFPTTPLFSNVATTSSPNEFYNSGPTTPAPPGLESTVSSILSTPIPRTGKSFPFVTSPDNQFVEDESPRPEEIRTEVTENPGNSLASSTGTPRNQMRRPLRRRKRPRSKIQIHPRAGFGVRRYRVRRPKTANNSVVYLDALRRPNIANQLPIVYDYFLEEGNPNNPINRNLETAQSQNIHVHVRHVGSPIPDSEAFKQFKQLSTIHQSASTEIPAVIVTKEKIMEPTPAGNSRKTVPKFRERQTRRNFTRLVVRPKVTPVKKPENLYRPRARKLKSVSVLLNMNQDVGNDLDIGASTNFAHAPIIHSFVPVDMDPMPTIYGASNSLDEERMMRNFTQYIVF